MDTGEEVVSSISFDKEDKIEEDLRGRKMKELKNALKNAFTSKKAQKNKANDIPNNGIYL